MEKTKIKVLYLLFSFLFLFVISLLSSSPALAAVRYWVGGTGNWDEPANWDDGSGGTGVPGEGDSASILSTGLKNIITYNTTANPSLHYVHLNNSILDQDQSTLTIGTNVHSLGNGFYIGAGGQYNLSGSGLLSLPTNGGNWLTIEGTFYQNGGTATVDITHINVNGLYTQDSGDYTTGDFYVHGTFDLNYGISNASGILVNGLGIVNNITSGTQNAGVLYMAESSEGGTYYLGGDGLIETYVGSVIGERYNGAIFNQDGGTHETGDLTLGNLAYMDEEEIFFRGEGEYYFNDGQLTVNDIAKIGNEGIGHFIQNGGTFDAYEVWIGVWDKESSGAYGEYYIYDGTLNADYLIIGGKDEINKPGYGYFYQDGGEVNAGGLWVADTADSIGEYYLTDGDLVVNTWDVIGMRGDGTFNQFSGTHTSYSILEVGGAGTGTYNLVDGELTTNGTIVGNWGTGVFNQGLDPVTSETSDGGTHTVNYDLILGSNSGITGYYNLYNGTLNANFIQVAQSGQGYFTQTGGTVNVNEEDSYGINIGQVYGSTGIYDIRESGELNTKNLNIGLSGTGIFNQEGGVVNVSELLVLGYDESGTGNGTYNLNYGDLYNSGSSYIGWGGRGEFNQTGGAHTTEWLDVGIDPGIEGTYDQSGGLTAVTNTLVMGRNAGATGSYILSGDSSVELQTGETVVGAYGQGTFVQTGGTHDTGTVVVGYNTGGQGSYELKSGDINSQFERIGLDGSGTFTQTGGTNTVIEEIVIAQGSETSGEYNIQGGILTSPELYVNYGGTFINTGGTVGVDLTTNYGTITGGGTFTGNVENYGDVKPGMSPGTLTINGDYLQDDSGTLFIELGGVGEGDYDLLNITGSADLGGTLEIGLFGLFEPVVGSYYDIVMANFIADDGGFDSIFGPTKWNWTVDYLDLSDYNIVRLTANAVPVPGAIWLFSSALAMLIGFIRRYRI